METYERIDVLDNNAGLMRTAPIEQFSHEHVEQTSTDMVKPQDVVERIAFIVGRPWHFNLNEVLFRRRNGWFSGRAPIGQEHRKLAKS